MPDSKPNIDYNLLVAAERIRFNSDFSSAHWLHQVISEYERGIANKLRNEAYEKALRTAINAGCKAAVKLARSYPEIAGFPSYLTLKGGNWADTCEYINKNFKKHAEHRFSYLKRGD